MICDVSFYTAALYLFFALVVFSLLTALQIITMRTGDKFKQRRRHLESHLFISLMAASSVWFYLGTGCITVIAFPLAYGLYHLIKENIKLYKGYDAT